MNKADFKPDVFFDLKSVTFASIFSGVEFVWEVLAEIEDFVAAQVGSKKVIIGEGTIVEEGAFIKGPALIGRNCTIAHGAYIRENVILGDNVRIGHSTEVKNSIFMNRATAAHLSYIGDSIVGNKAGFGGGSKTANVRFDGKTVRIKVGDNYVDTGLIKFGAIVGDSCQIGANAALNPGTILGKNCLVYPLTSVVGVKSEGTTIK